MMKLELLDILFTILHLVIIGFNLLGWIWPATRRLHFIIICATAACWFILGIWFGIGYCPITDWHWQIKEKLGGQNLPNSFITYYADKLTGRSINEQVIDVITSVSFFAAAALSVYFNFFAGRSPAKKKH